MIGGITAAQVRMEKIRKPSHIAETAHPHTYNDESASGTVFVTFDRAKILKEVKPKLAEHDAELEQFLSHPDLRFSELHNLFLEHVRKTGGTDINFIDADRIFREAAVRIPDDNVDARYEPWGNYIVVTRKCNLQSRELDETAFESEYDLQYARQFEVFVPLLMLIHEEWHAVGVQQEKTRLPFGLYASGRGGFREDQKIIGVNQSTHFRRLDEGFVELMSRRVLQEYVSRVGVYRGMNAKDAAAFIAMDAVTVGGEHEGYNSEVTVLEMFIEACAEILKKDTDEILHGLLRSYLRGGDIFSDELATAFTDAGWKQQFDQVKRYFSDPRWPDISDRLNVENVSRTIIALGEIIRSFREQKDRGV